jgi:uncharacterized protein (DUF1778 family)
MTEEKKNESIRKFADFKQIGKNLIDSAIEQRNKNLTQVVINQVEQHMQDAIKNEQLAAQFNARAEHAKKRITAIEAGEFTVSAVSHKIEFNDATLNEDCTFTSVEQAFTRKS